MTEEREKEILKKIEQDTINGGWYSPDKMGGDISHEELDILVKKGFLIKEDSPKSTTLYGLVIFE